MNPKHLHPHVAANTINRPATSALPHAVRPAREVRPLELVCTTPLLLTENAWTAIADLAMGVRVETLAIRATQVTLTLRSIRGYPCDAIND